MLFKLKNQLILCLYLISDLLRDIRRQIAHCDILLVRHDGDCGYTYQGKAYSPLIDSFGDICTKHGLKIGSVATNNSKLIGDRAYFSPISYDKQFILYGIIGEIIKILKGNVIATKWLESHRVLLWCKILEKGSPKCIIGIQPDEYLCQAGRIKKIPVYDLQHGVIADDHPGYGATYRKDYPRKSLPDGFLCWDQQSMSSILKWAHNKDIRVINVGNPWFLRFIKVNSDDMLVKNALADHDLFEDDRPYIVVTLQWGLTIIYPNRTWNGIIVDALEKVILDTLELYNWVIRLHPIQLRGNERDRVVNYLKSTYGVENTNKWLSISEIPLPILLRKANLHITDSSTVVIEAAWMGIRSGLLSEQLGLGGMYQSYFSYERSMGIAEVIPQNSEILKKWIINTLLKGRLKPSLTDFGRNLEVFIDEIARENS